MCKIFDVNHVVRTRIFVNTLQDSNSAQVTTSNDHHLVSNSEFDVFFNFVGDQIEFHHIVDFDVGVRVTDGPTVVGSNVGDSLRSDLSLSDLQEFVGGFFLIYSVEGEASLNVVQKAEVLVGAVDGDNVHESSGEGSIGSDLSVDFDNALHQDHGDFLVGQGILEAISEDDDQRKALSELVWTSGGAGSKDSTEFIQHPMFGRIDTF